MMKDLDRYPVVIEQNVAWGDMDAHGHVNNVEYLRYMENGRVAYYLQIGKYDFEGKTGITLVIKSVVCHYLSVLTYPDQISIGARVKTIAEDHIIMEYNILNNRNDRVAAMGEATIVAFCINDKAKVPFPEELKQRIIRLQRGVI
jgi:acyl-CoA thioester hydrolase